MSLLWQYLFCRNNNSQPSNAAIATPATESFVKYDHFCVQLHNDIQYQVSHVCINIFYIPIVYTLSRNKINILAFFFVGTYNVILTNI